PSMENSVAAPPSMATELIHFENSELLPLGSVAVAVATKGGQIPSGGKVAEKRFVPVASVVTLAAPRNVSPSPKPLGSQRVLAKNSRRYVVFGIEESTP